MTRPPQLFGIVPAAGHSRRMGCHKLLLPLGIGRVIDELLRAFEDSSVTATVVVVRRDDVALQQAVQTSSAILCTPEVDPADMRRSVEAALDEIEQRYSPSDDDGWLLVPADHPLLDRRILERVVARWRRGDCRILVPVSTDQQGNVHRGHPTVFRWEHRTAVRELPADRGINSLLQMYSEQVTELPLDDAAVITDLDTPADYERLQREFDTENSTGDRSAESG